MSARDVLSDQAQDMLLDAASDAVNNEFPSMSAETGGLAALSAYKAIFETLPELPLASRLALARALVPEMAVVPHEIPADLDGVRQLIGITRAQYVRIVAAIEAARPYDATAAEEPPHEP